MRALITAAEGDIQRFYAYARPNMADYAERHGYELVEGPWDTEGRHPYWIKLAAILDKWQKYEDILWLDADVIIQPGAPDVFDEVPEGKWLGIAEHHTCEGQSPNVGVMAIRTTEQALQFFGQCWRLYKRYKDHRWPDQAPVMQLLGYTLDLPVSWVGPTQYTNGVEILGRKWNALPRFGETGYFLHFAGLPVDARLELLGRLCEGVAR